MTFVKYVFIKEINVSENYLIIKLYDTFITNSKSLAKGHEPA